MGDRKTVNDNLDIAKVISQSRLSENHKSMLYASREESRRDKEEATRV